MRSQETIEQNNQYFFYANRNVKSSLFCFIFKEKEDLLDLYNALNQSDHTNIEDLKINTIDEVVYISMKDTLILIKLIYMAANCKCFQIHSILCFIMD